MKSLDEQLAFAFLDVHKAHSTKCDSSARIKGMNQFIFALAGLQLVVQHPEHVCRNVFEFKLCVIGYALLTIDLFNVLSFEV